MVTPDVDIPEIHQPDIEKPDINKTDVDEPDIIPYEEGEDDEIDIQREHCRGLSNDAQENTFQRMSKTHRSLPRGTVGIKRENRQRKSLPKNHKIDLVRFTGITGKMYMNLQDMLHNIACWLCNQLVEYDNKKM